MKKQSKKARIRDVLRSIKARRKITTSMHFKPTCEVLSNECKKVTEWINKEIEKGLCVKPFNPKNSRSEIIIELPKRLDFSENADQTLQYLMAIRKLGNLLDIKGDVSFPKKAYKLRGVCFERLEHFSTSAALVLTAEISKWDSSIRSSLKPNVEKWHSNIYEQLKELGYFELFNYTINRPAKSEKSSNVKFVKYIKGGCGDTQVDKENKKRLKLGVKSLVGQEIPKWTILHSGLSEAITNVIHHAYPTGYMEKRKDKSWFLTGSYDANEKQLKIVFYDQGIGIPNSLPVSKIKEKVLDYFSKNNIGKLEQVKEQVLLKAAMELDRTSTNQNDRGKGLQDLLSFIEERGEGYLSIISSKGLYKCTVSGLKKTVKSTSFDKPLLGTLIIWSTNLNKDT